MAIGIVSYVSRNSGMLVVSHDDGHTVVELLGREGQVERGDAVTGDWSANGREYLRRRGDPELYDAYFQGTWPTFEGAVRIARGA